MALPAFGLSTALSARNAEQSTDPSTVDPSASMDTVQSGNGPYLPGVTSITSVLHHAHVRKFPALPAGSSVIQIEQ
jgi:hypothetical protein